MKIFGSLYNKFLFLLYCSRLIGVPYRWGGDDFIEGFDCSGGVQEVLMAFGIDPKGDQTSAALFKHFSDEKYGKESPPKMGSLCFFGKSKVTHVSIALSKDLMFEFGGGNSKTKTKDDAAQQNAYGRIRPIAARSDLKGVLMPHEMKKFLY